MVASIPRSGCIHAVRIIDGLFGKRVEICRKLVSLRFDENGPVAWDNPAGIGAWRKARSCDMPELSVFLAAYAASVAGN